jgi:hypothetical protein
MQLRADQARDRLIGVFVIDYFFGRSTLRGLAGVWTAAKEWRHL